MYFRDTFIIIKNPSYQIPAGTALIYADRRTDIKVTGDYGDCAKAPKNYGRLIIGLWSTVCETPYVHTVRPSHRLFI